MTLGDIQNKIYSLTGTDVNSYSNAQMLIDLNLWQHRIVTMITDSQDESDWDDTNHGDYPSLTVPLSLNRDYFIPQTEHVISIKDISVSYDGTTWNKAKPMDIAATEMPNAPASATTQNTTNDNLFPKTDPAYDIKYNAIFLYPRAVQADIDAGGKIFIEWTREAKEFSLSDLTTGTVVPGFDTAFHPMMAYGASYEYLFSKKDFNAADRVKPTLDDLEARLRRQYGNKQKDRVLFMKPSDSITQGYK